MPHTCGSGHVSAGGRNEHRRVRREGCRASSLEGGSVRTGSVFGHDYARPLPVRRHGVTRPRSSADRAPASGAGGAGSSPAGGAYSFRWSDHISVSGHVTSWRRRTSVAVRSAPWCSGCEERPWQNTCGNEVQRPGDSTAPSGRTATDPSPTRSNTAEATKKEASIAVVAFVAEVAEDGRTSSPAETIRLADARHVLGIQQHSAPSRRNVQEPRGDQAHGAGPSSKLDPGVPLMRLHDLWHRSATRLLVLSGGFTANGRLRSCG